MVVVISTNSRSVNFALTLLNSSVGTSTFSVIASVYSRTSRCCSSNGNFFPSSELHVPTGALKIACKPSSGSFPSLINIGAWCSHSYHALFSTATRHMALSRSEWDIDVPVRMAPRNEFLSC